MSNFSQDLRVVLGLFNSGRFFEAHEALEDLWRDLPASSPAKKHLQGLVQLAVAFHHESCGNLPGARSVLDRALSNLEGAESSFPSLDMEQLRLDLAEWQAYFAQQDKRPSRLHIVWHSGR